MLPNSPNVRHGRRARRRAVGEGRRASCRRARCRPGSPPRSRSTRRAAPPTTPRRWSEALRARAHRRGHRGRARRRRRGAGALPPRRRGRLRRRGARRLGRAGGDARGGARRARARGRARDADRGRRRAARPATPSRRSRPTASRSSTRAAASRLLVADLGRVTVRRVAAGRARGRGRAVRAGLSRRGRRCRAYEFEAARRRRPGPSGGRAGGRQRQRAARHRDVRARRPAARGRRRPTRPSSACSPSTPPPVAGDRHTLVQECIDRAPRGRPRAPRLLEPAARWSPPTPSTGGSASSATPRATGGRSPTSSSWRSGSIW